MHDPLGDRMKALEHASAPAAISPDTLIYVRVDGRGFSKFTSQMSKPFDLRMTAAMTATAKELLEVTGARASYVQSDEISLVWEPTPEIGEHYFGGKPFKMASVIAAQTTVIFNEMIRRPEIGLETFARLRPHFDARVVAVQDRETAAEMVAWRGQDARRNGITMIAQSRYSHKSLQGMSSSAMRDRLSADGVLPDQFPQENLFGTLFYTAREMRPLDEQTRMAIPEHSRPAPDHLFDRRVVKKASTHHPGAFCNLADVLFEGAEPAFAPREQPLDALERI